MAKYEAFSDWLEDQASMINCLGKISSDLPILESQRHQIESLLNENENKKSRADRLEQIANELSDPDFKSKMGHLLDQWEALNGRLKDRRNKIDETIIILKKVEAQNKKVEKFNQDAAELINDTIKIQPQLENIDEFISQVNQISKNHKNASKIKLRRYSEGVLYCSKSVIFSSSRFFFAIVILYLLSSDYGMVKIGSNVAFVKVYTSVILAIPILPVILLIRGHFRTYPFI